MVISDPIAAPLSGDTKANLTSKKDGSRDGLSVSGFGGREIEC